MAAPRKPAPKSAAKAKPAAHKATAAHGHAANHLHYNKEELLEGYRGTFSMFMKTLMIGVGGAVLYFFFVILYLGAYGHSHTDNYIKEFGTRIQYDYKGTKLPMYEDPSLAGKPADAQSTH